MSRGLVVVCGLRAEAKIAHAPGVTVLIAGGDQGRLQADLERAARDARAIISFGVAGGLAPGMKPGDVRVADTIVLPAGERVSTDAPWAQAIARVLNDAPLAAVAGVDAPVSDPRAKASLYKASGAATVDMESHIAVRVATAHSLPFAAVRVVTDTAERPLPHAATVGMRADGGVDLPAIFMSLGRDPAQLPSLIRTGLDARKAFAALLRCRQLLGPGFAFVDLG